MSMKYPFRLGATSYIIPVGLVPNARYLAGRVQDMELVLFDLDDGPSNLPAPAQVAELRDLALEQELSYTVHLPLDLRLTEDGSPNHPSLLKARKVIDCTLGLEPWAYVAHLDGRSLLSARTTPTDWQRWQDHSVRALELVAGWLGDPARLALENLEGYPLDSQDGILARVPVSRTVDIGHLWLDGHDPLPYLRAALPRTRVIHLHGIAERDHASLAHVPPAWLVAVLAELEHFHYSGVLTLEVFSEPDFLSSLQVLQTLNIARSDPAESEMFI